MDELKEELLKYLPKLIEGIRSMAKYFHEGNNQKALELLSQVIEGVDWISSGYAMQPVARREKVSELNIALSKVNEAMQSKDYILTADIFEYEIVEILTIILNDVSEMNLN